MNSDQESKADQQKALKDPAYTATLAAFLFTALLLLAARLFLKTLLSGSSLFRTTTLLLVTHVSIPPCE